MSKRSLSDLLREEAQDSSVSPPDAAVPETRSVELATDQRNESAEVSQLQSQLSQAQAQVDSLKAALQREKSQGEDLKKQLGDLAEIHDTARQKADQQQAKALETAQQTIKTLEQTLKQEQSTVKALQKELTAISQRSATRCAQLQTDLETEKTLVGKLYSKIQDLENHLAETPSSSPATLALRPPALPRRYIAPEQPPSHLTDEDIGWFD